MPDTEPEIKEQAQTFAKTVQDAMKTGTLNRLTMTVTRNGIDIATIHDNPKTEKHAEDQLSAKT
jgi:hypothetical protein